MDAHPKACHIYQACHQHQLTFFFSWLRKLCGFSSPFLNSHFQSSFFVNFFVSPNRPLPPAGLCMRIYPEYVFLIEAGVIPNRMFVQASSIDLCVGSTLPSKLICHLTVTKTSSSQEPTPGSPNMRVMTPAILCYSPHHRCIRF